MKSRHTSAVILLFTLMLTGCSDAPKPGRGVPVSGRITLAGKPLADADIFFTNDTFIGFGKTDVDGRYRLVQGALPGLNRVSMSRFDGQTPPSTAAQPPGDGMDAGQMAAASMGWGNAAGKKTGPKQLVPPDYSDPATTKLTFDVPKEGGADVNFDL